MGIPDRDKLRAHLDELGVARVGELLELGVFARNKTQIIEQWLAEKTPAPLRTGAQGTPTAVDLAIAKLKKHPLIAAAVAIGALVIYLGNVVDAFHKIVPVSTTGQTEKVLEETAAARQPVSPDLPSECVGLVTQQMTRKPSIAYPQWLVAIAQMQADRNLYDMQNLVETWGRIPVGLTGEQLILESTFTLRCLERTHRILIERSEKKGQWWGVQFENVGIKFIN